MSDWAVQAWDSTVFLSLLTNQDSGRSAVIRALLAHHAEGKLKIIVPTFAIAEVRSYRRSGSQGPAPGNEGEDEETDAIDEVERQRITELFDSDKLIYRALTDRTALSAQNIGNQFPSLLPGDCVHIATAIEAKADVLFTYDGVGKRRRPGEMCRYDARIGTPPLRILEPFDPWPKLGLDFSGGLETVDTGA